MYRQPNTGFVAVTAGYHSLGFKIEVVAVLNSEEFSHQ
jgi:hypothetical protein